MLSSSLSFCLLSFMLFSCRLIDISSSSADCRSLAKRVCSLSWDCNESTFVLATNYELNMTMNNGLHTQNDIPYNSLC